MQIADLKRCDVIQLSAGAGIPAVQKPTTLVVFSVEGNSALLNDGTRITYCNGDAVKIHLFGQRQYLYIVKPDALKQSRELGMLLDNETSLVEPMIVDIGTRSTIAVVNLNVGFDFNPSWLTGEHEILVSGAGLDAVPMEQGDSLIYKNRIVAKFEWVQLQPEAKACLFIYRRN